MVTDQPEFAERAMSNSLAWSTQTTVLAQLSRLDEAIKIEFELVNARMTWLVVSESFIIASFVTAMAYYSPGHQVANGLLVVMLLTAILGLFLAVIVIPAISAAHSATDILKAKRGEWEVKVEPEHMRVQLISSKDKPHGLGKLPAIWIPWVLVGLWCTLIVLLLILWLGGTFAPAAAGRGGSIPTAAIPALPDGPLNSGLGSLGGSTPQQTLAVTTNEMVVAGPCRSDGTYATWRFDQASNGTDLPE